MKKILLSLFIVVGIFSVDTCFATEEVCYAIKVSGNMEKDKCNGKNKHESCSPSNAPANSGWCIDNTTDANVNFSCAAKECNSGYLLYTTKIRQEIEVVGENGKKVGSQGICYSEQALQAKCDCGNCGGDSTKECKLKKIKVKNYGKEIDAFIGEEACHCVPKQSADEYCTYTFEGKVQCNNGASTTTRDNLQIKKSELNGVKCTQEQQTFSTWYNTNKDKLQNWFDANCKNPTIIKGSVSNGNAKLENAKQKIQEFFKFAEDNKSGWETADGKFNTKRLASDLSAGVVLGTVGGVVSGVVIKKKQVEKGFDVLHCTVGGQTVADWGDEFSVGFQR